MASGVDDIKRWVDRGRLTGVQVRPGDWLPEYTRQLVKASEFVSQTDGQRIHFMDGSQMVISPGVRVFVRRKPALEGDW